MIQIDDNIIRFPKENKRYNLSNIPVDEEEIAKNIKLMKMSYFSEVSEEIMDDIMRSLSSLRIEETAPLQHNDIILIKESIISALCRAVEIEHPLHKIGSDNIIISKIEDEFCTYKFKGKDDTDEGYVVSNDI